MNSVNLPMKKPGCRDISQYEAHTFCWSHQVRINPWQVVHEVRYLIPNILWNTIAPSRGAGKGHGTLEQRKTHFLPSRCGRSRTVPDDGEVVQISRRITLGQTRSQKIESYGSESRVVYRWVRYVRRQLATGERISGFSPSLGSSRWQNATSAIHLRLAIQ